MKKTILIAFDFDGTIVASHEQVLAALGAALGSLGVPVPSNEVLRRTSSRDLVRNLGIGPLRVLQLLRASRKHIAAADKPLELYAGMGDFLRSLQGRGFTLAILSSNSEQKIHAILAREQILDLFVEIRGDLGLWSKTRALLSVYKKTKPARALYIGDEERDIECALNAGYQSVAVGWGFKDADFLRRHNPRYFVNTLPQLAALIVEIEGAR